MYGVLEVDLSINLFYLRYEGYVVDLVESLSCKMADSNLEIKALQTNNISYNSILGGLYIWSLMELN